MRRRAGAFQPGQVVLAHRQHQVEVGKIELGHAPRALRLAEQIRRAGMQVTARWTDAELRLGVGVGVASGFVTVGVIGGASRLEYTAVGPAVNLAARLCSEAEHGEVLVDPRTIELLGDEAKRERLTPGEALKLKGFQQPVQSYTLAAA